MTLRLGDTLIAGSGANTDLSNLSSQGKNIANWSNNVTNCITQIPQDIKLELNNGTLTLKAGSKVYVPNGVGVFDVVTISEDYTVSVGEPTGERTLFFNTEGTFFVAGQNTNLYSGATAPTPSTANAYWYDTTNNLIKRTRDTGSTWNTVTGATLPIAIVTFSSGTVTSIDQVFNGFGYIGSTTFALPGVKGLIPNGRNADGTLKNIEFTIDTVKTATRTWVDSNFQVWGYTKNPPTGVTETWYFNAYIESDEEPSYNEYVMWYKPSENITYVNNELQSSTPNWEKVNYINFGKASGINSQEIKIFTPKTAFHALDYNDSSKISGWSMPSSRYIDLTIGASGTTYVAPVNGWFLIRSGTSGASTNYTGYLENTSKPARIPLGAYNFFTGGGYLPVKKGDVVVLHYQSNIINEYFRFYYAEGEN